MPGEEGGHDSTHSGSDDKHEGSGVEMTPPTVAMVATHMRVQRGPLVTAMSQLIVRVMMTMGTQVSTTGGSGVDVMQSVARLLEEQRKMMAAQVQAMAAHSIPPLRKFTGEDTHTDEGCFERWIEQFEDHAKMASWSDEQRLFQ